MTVIEKRRTTAATTKGNNIVTTTRAKYSVVTSVCVAECVSLAFMCMTLSLDVQ